MMICDGKYLVVAVCVSFVTASFLVDVASSKPTVRDVLLGTKSKNPDSSRERRATSIPAGYNECILLVDGRLLCDGEIVAYDIRPDINQGSGDVDGKGGSKCWWNGITYICFG
ncbi:uncharacterized protein LOC141912899 [Tubulanus polymorphus]|uniref:uncharacterized protein LOC141912899 n=1 Tax=Tubulanus polymorphus TaxID=672921 RepID=UPI003DA608DF